jgi:hypothetical protein
MGDHLKMVSHFIFLLIFHAEPFDHGDASTACVPTSMALRSARKSGFYDL